jgi:hypothetical protein
MAARIDQITSVGTYGGAAATAATGLLNWLGANQSGLTVLAMLVTAAATVLSALYGMYHRHKVREIARTQGFSALRKGEHDE